MGQSVTGRSWERARAELRNAGRAVGKRSLELGVVPYRLPDVLTGQ